MRAFLTVLGCFVATSVQANGLLIPKDKTIHPLAMLRHQVTVVIQEQAAVTRVEQTFRNHTEAPLEATYVFPVPRGGSVQQFSMWVNGREVKGELVEAGRARVIYAETVRRLLDPGLLEYLGNDLFRLKVFPVPARGDVKVALSFTTELLRDAGVIEYLYPLKTDGKATSTLEHFALDITLQARHGVQNIYSPTHAITVSRPSDHEAKIVFQKQQALLDKDFQLLYSMGHKDVGVTLVPQRPTAGAKGHFMLLLSPRAELPKDHAQPRDLVLVLDVSGSMAGTSIVQAKRALKFVLDRLGPRDRFGLITFSDTVNPYGPGLWESTPENVGRAKSWVDGIEAVGGTNINDALLQALEMRQADSARSFTVLFFTDGLPTAGVTEPEQIVKNILAKNTANTRVFTFGVGPEVNATLLDQLALRTRAASAYVGPAEDIESKVSRLHAKISHPALVNLKLSAGKEVVLEEMYPPKLPDLFHGGQVMVLGKYTGHGRVKLTLEGMLGKEKRLYEYTVDFPEKTRRDRDMVETIWARRKIGFLLDLIRAGGEQKELVTSVTALAKKYGIATPYTSYLVVPESPLPVVGFGPMTGGPVSNFGPFMPGFIGGISGSGNGSFSGGGGFGGGGFGGGMVGGGAMGGAGGSMLGGRLGGGMMTPIAGMTSYLGGMAQLGGGMMGMGGGMMGGGGMGMGGGMGPFSKQSANGKKQSLAEWARTLSSRPGALSNQRGQVEQDRLTFLGQGSSPAAKASQNTTQSKATMDQTLHHAFAKGAYGLTQSGQLGVDLSIQGNDLRNQSRAALSAQRKVAGRTLLEIGGVWIDEGFDAKMSICAVKAFSPAYFQLLERQPRLRELFQLGNYLIWVTPSRSALVIDLEDGQDTLEERKIGKLFTRAAGVRE